MAAQQFEKHLTPNDITRKFSVPIAWLDAMPEFGEGRHEVLLRAVDGVSFGWQFICAVRNSRYKIPVLNLVDCCKNLTTQVHAIVTSNIVMNRVIASVPFVLIQC
ncbi:hypothetical protein TIFTF001_034766 [Ficus carica]|uniref:Uncharacterized protein n=1 Tax=Ficus carica TaxID=3494 RepID=A0AA88E8F1_FICCA|nr:hypothetical protein TIFTF001_034766 [Ficus carica]